MSEGRKLGPDEVLQGPRRQIPEGVKLIFELTSLCNFHCVHCIREESPVLAKAMGRDKFLSPGLIDRVLGEVEPYGMVDNVALTGGEPTIHPQFAEIVQTIARHRYLFGFVTNGWNFPRTLAVLLPVKDFVRSVTFSLDGATEATHDTIRKRKGSFRQVLAAIEECRRHGIQVQINMTITRASRGEMVEMALLASRLGCDAVGYAHCQPTEDALAAGLVMDLMERRLVEAEIAELQRQFTTKLYLAGDHWSDSLFYQCPQLRMREFNIDYRGYLTACCTLSNYRGGAVDTDVVADLNRVSFFEAHQALMDRIGVVNREKIQRLKDGAATPADHFICSHCLKHYDKVPNLDTLLLPSLPVRRGRSDVP